VRFTIVSHACMYVEHGDARLLVDPWIVGSCYWRSWWNFPEPTPALVESLRPTAIYLTHLHWDHFHGPSLRRFDRRTRVFIPRTTSPRMADDLRWLGFADIVEIPHGGTVELGSDLQLSSFQFSQPPDSAIVVTDGKTTLFNVNDTKIFGPPLRQITSRFPSIDFVFRSHSSASPLPYCVDGYESRFPEVLAPQDFIEEFAAFVLRVGARWAVPFASNHCFLHRETIEFNRTAVNPEAVAAYYDAEAERRGRSSRARVMPPGSSWDEVRGFSIVPFDYGRKDEHIAEMLAQHRPQLEAQYAREEATVGDFASFSSYFDGFFATLPPFVSRVVGRRVVFEVVEKARRRAWVVDLVERCAREIDAAASDDLVIAIPALVINDCTHKRMFSAWTPSKRLRVRVPGPSLAPLTAFLVLLDLHETGLLPLHRQLTPRALARHARRLREVGAAVELVARAALSRSTLKPKSFFLGG